MIRTFGVFQLLLSMKFGRNLPRNQVPEWASQYINYKTLKKLIKNAQEDAERVEQEPDLAGRTGG